MSFLYQQKTHENSSQNEVKSLYKKGVDQLTAVKTILKNINNDTYLNMRSSINSNGRDDRKTTHKKTYELALVKAEEAKETFAKIIEKDTSKNNYHACMANEKISEIDKLINTIECELSWCTCCGKPCCTTL